jgi:hypothetical protein
MKLNHSLRVNGAGKSVNWSATRTRTTLFSCVASDAHWGFNAKRLADTVLRSSGWLLERSGPGLEGQRKTCPDGVRSGAEQPLLWRLADLHDLR